MSFIEVIDTGKLREQGWVLRGVNFSVQKGQLIGVAGETGSGKTTLLKIIAGLLQADAGQVVYNGIKLKGPEEKLMPGHPEISYLSQHFELLNNYTVGEFFEIKRKVSVEKAIEIYKKCKIDHLLNRKTNSISGGERQRIALASELIKGPAVLLLDEPFSNLDPTNKSALKAVLMELVSSLKLTVLMVSHDTTDLLTWASFIIVLRKGVVVESGTPNQISKLTKLEYTSSLFNISKSNNILSILSGWLQSLKSKFFA